MEEPELELSLDVDEEPELPFATEPEDFDPEDFDPEDFDPEEPLTLELLEPLEVATGLGAEDAVNVWLWLAPGVGLLEEADVVAELGW